MPEGLSFSAFCDWKDGVNYVLCERKPNSFHFFYFYFHFDFEREEEEGGRGRSSIFSSSFPTSLSLGIDSEISSLLS